MFEIAMPKVVLASLLALSLIGSVIGMSHIANGLPNTGYAPTHELNNTIAMEPLQDFVHAVENGQSRAVVGIYVPGVLALPVGQQPDGDASFVTRDPSHVTQFGLANQFGTVGILAHNDLAGAQFPRVQINQYAIVVYGDGRLEYYEISDVQKYQALSPTSTFSEFVNLNGSQEHLSAAALFNRVYGPGGRLVLQTCIDAFGDASWGRVFIIAEPATSQVLSVVQQTSFLLQFASFGMASNN